MQPGVHVRRFVCRWGRGCDSHQGHALPVPAGEEVAVARPRVWDRAYRMALLHSQTSVCLLSKPCKAIPNLARSHVRRHALDGSTGQESAGKLLPGPPLYAESKRGLWRVCLAEAAMWLHMPDRQRSAILVQLCHSTPQLITVQHSRCGRHSVERKGLKLDGALVSRHGHGKLPVDTADEYVRLAAITLLHTRQPEGIEESAMGPGHWKWLKAFGPHLSGCESSLSMSMALPMPMARSMPVAARLSPAPVCHPPAVVAKQVLRPQENPAELEDGCHAPDLHSLWRTVTTRVF